MRLRHSNSLAIVPPVRQLVARHRRVASADSVQNLFRAGNIGIASVTPKELHRPRDGKLLSHSDIDELIERNSL